MRRKRERQTSPLLEDFDEMTLGDEE